MQSMVLRIVSGVPIHNHIDNYKYNDCQPKRNLHNSTVLPNVVQHYAWWVADCLQELVLQWLFPVPLHHNAKYQLHNNNYPKHNGWD